DALREQSLALDARYRQSGQLWLARLVRRAASSLLGEDPAQEDAGQPFFIGAAQDRWREARASIGALGAGPATGRSRGATAVSDRLIWTVRVDADNRIADIVPLEQKAGARGLAKPKPVTLATLVKRKDLPAHDAAVLRAVRREDYGNRPVLDTT